MIYAVLSNSGFVAKFTRNIRIRISQIEDRDPGHRFIYKLHTLSVLSSISAHEEWLNLPDK